ncbi:MAG: hypothetical protein GXP25_00020 [Planctomycetes bacterium]|nr:hypothetical protein [Planctomycetota bacterium]
MPIEFKCHSCGGKLKVATEHGGRHGRCPFCRKLLKVPDNAPAIDEIVGEATEEITASILEDAAADVVPPPPTAAPEPFHIEPPGLPPKPKTSKTAPKKKAAPPPPPKGGKGGISFECLLCGEKISVAKEMAGKKISCPGCDNPLTVPSS